MAGYVEPDNHDRFPTPCHPQPKVHPSGRFGLGIQTKYWIPAYAGMTMNSFFLLSFSGLGDIFCSSYPFEREEAYMPTIRVPDDIKQEIGIGIIATSGYTLGENLFSLCNQYPQLLIRLFDDDGRLSPSVTVFVNERDVTVHDGLLTLVDQYADINIEFRRF